MLVCNWQIQGLAGHQLAFRARYRQRDSLPAIRPRHVTPGGLQLTRTKVKDWLEGIGFVAIIASLVFVGIETRNSTRQATLTTQALEISAYQELMDNIAELNKLVVQDAEVAAFLYKAYDTTEELSDFERFRLGRNIFLRFRHGDIAYFQYERGAIDEERLRSSLRVLNIGNPRVQAFWGQYKENFVGPYRDYVDRLIDERNALQGFD